MLRAAARFLEGQRDGARRRFAGEQPDGAARRDLDEPAAQLGDEPWHDAEPAAGQDERKRVAPHFQPRRDRSSRQRQLLGGAFEDLRRDAVALLVRLLHDWPERRHIGARHVPVVHDAHEAGGIGHAKVREHIGGEACLGAASIHLAHDGCQRAAADPVAASLVADQMTPAAGARGRARRVAAVRDRSGARDDDDARPHARAGHQRDQRVVDDEHAPTRTDPAHDRTNNPRVVLTVDAGDPDADCRRLDGAIAERAPR